MLFDNFQLLHFLPQLTTLVLSIPIYEFSESTHRCARNALTEVLDNALTEVLVKTRIKHELMPIRGPESTRRAASSGFLATNRHLRMLYLA